MTLNSFVRNCVSASYDKLSDQYSVRNSTANPSWHRFTRRIRIPKPIALRKTTSVPFSFTWGYQAGGLQGALNTVNGLQDIAITMSPGMMFSGFSGWDWSLGLVTHESGTPGGWDDTHGWSKWLGAEGVVSLLTLGAGAMARFAPGHAVEMHHLLPQSKKLRPFFDRAGLNIEDFKIPLDLAKHRLKPDGVHTNGGGNWNKVWAEFFKKSPTATKDEIMTQLKVMREFFGI